MNAYRLFTVVLLLSLILVTALPTATPVLAQSAMAPTRAAVAEVMQRVNDYWMAQPADVPEDIAPDREDWKRAIYFTGDWAHYSLTQAPRYYDFARQWAEGRSWSLYPDCRTVYADMQAAAQTYLALYEFDPLDHATQQALECVQQSMIESMTWGWVEIDLGSVQSIREVRVHPFADRAYRYFVQVKTTADEPYQTIVNRHDNRGAATVVSDTFAPVKKTPLGQKNFWARGNGWVIAALARTLDSLPVNAPHYGEYRDLFITMAARLKTLQQPDGFWYQSLLEPTYYGGIESSGTALFTYALAWGINHDLLPRAEYVDTVLKAWDGLVMLAVQPDGSVGYVQTVGQRPMPPPTVNDRAEYGVGAFLLAGSEVYKLATDAPPVADNLALNQPVICSSEPEPENPCTHVVDGDLLNRWSATPFEQWVEVDLGGFYNIDRTKLYPYLSRAYQYIIEARRAPSAPYTVIVDRTGNTQGGAVIEDRFPATTVRYVRLRVVAVDQQVSEWVSIQELAIFGTATLATLAVNTTADPGDGLCSAIECTLHEAIGVVNSMTGANTIAFQILGTGAQSIRLTTPLPTLTDPVLIDGYTQSATSTDPAALNAGLMIEIDGSGLAPGQNVFGEGLRIDGNQNTVRGLAINRFAGPAIILWGSAAGNVIEGNFLGSGTAGNTALGNGIGIQVNALAPVDAPNLLQGNLVVASGKGIMVEQASHLVIRHNRIGVGTFDTPLSNQTGISTFEAADIEIQENLIANNQGKGINALRGGTYHFIGNLIRNNGDLGIDLNGDGVTLNDPGDGDQGANNLQNFPIVGMVTRNGATKVEGVLNSTPNTNFTLAFYANTLCDPSRFGEGERFLGTLAVTTDGRGNVPFVANLPVTTARGAFVTATATGSRGTSEFSACRVAGAALINALLNAKKPVVSYDPTPVAYAPAGVMRLTATFTNHTKLPLEQVYFRVATLSGDNLLLNADDGPGVVGTVLSVPPTIAPKASFTVLFMIGLQQRQPFTFFVDAYSLIPAEATAADLQTTETDAEVDLSIDATAFDEADGDAVTNPIYLPLISQ